MSVAYTAIGWNRQKKIYDSIIAFSCVVYIVLFAGVTLLFNPEATFETLLIRSTSTLALLLLHIILAIGPACRLNKKFLPVLYNRRHLGVTMFLVASIHGIFSMIQFHGLGNVNILVSVLISNTSFQSLHAFPFQLLGLAALLILFMMAATSHDFWLHNLSPRVWKKLHMLVYLAWALILLHVMLGVVQLERKLVMVLMLFAGFVFITVLHLLAAAKENRTDNVKNVAEKDGFLYVCKVQDIAENRAKIFFTGKERVAVYRYEDALYAIHNVCKHQGGPLGEGIIKDGCITCPWHGYQYLPQNGQSPPPFREKVSTYELKLIGDTVWINPVPFPEGTSQAGVKITDHDK